MIAYKRPFSFANFVGAACLGSAVLIAVPAVAQNQSSVGTTDAAKTGVEPRGTKVGPSTNPAETHPGTWSGSRESTEATGQTGVSSGPATGGNVVPGAAVEKNADRNRPGIGKAAEGSAAAPSAGGLSAGGVGVESKEGTEGGPAPAKSR